MGSFKTDVTYLASWPEGAVFWSPDGEGRYWYDTLIEALEDGAPRTVRQATAKEEAN